MKRYLFILGLLCISVCSVNAQILQKPSAYSISQSPLWAQKMYGMHPNVYEVDRLFNAWRKKNPDTKNYHTQYYKRWKLSLRGSINEQGFIMEKDIQRVIEENEQFKEKVKKKYRSSWSLVGPLQSYNNNNNDFAREQATVYSVDRSVSNPAIMFCGTETGMVFKSTDTGNTWVDMGKNYDFNGGVSAVEIDPTNPNNVLIGSGGSIYRSNNAGLTWTLSLALSNLNVCEILIMPNNPTIVYAACEKGLYKSTNAGVSFTQVYAQSCWDIKANPLNANTLFLIKDNPTLKIAEFYKSINGGSTWNLMSNGWYFSNDVDRNDGGARIAVTQADTNRVYAYLIGEAKANDNGYIGVYRSNDGGNSWILPNGPDGGPYTATHQNLAIGSVSWQYWQGYYNCAIMASNTNPDQILIGGLNLWKSDDGGLTFSTLAGYAATNGFDIHVDMQDFRATGNEYWITTDGGIFKSTDFFATEPLKKNNGIYACDYWGFGSGWNEDVLVGGLYHNGNMAYHENYGPGKFLNIGGGEASTGYVNPGINRKVYCSDIGSRILPTAIGGIMTGASFSMHPNESYGQAESSEMEFFPSCYNMAFLGFENKLWKTNDGGTSFNLVHTFDTNVNNKVLYIEISRSNSNVMYVSQIDDVNSKGVLWKTTDGGLNWSSLSIPNGSNRKILIALDPKDEKIVYIAYHEVNTGAKIYKSIDGGASWINLSTSMLNGENIVSLALIANTNGGIYVGTNKTVYYRNNTMGNWQVVNTGLPTFFNTNIARPFYRDSKLRIASYGKGIWETPFEQNPSAPVAQITVDKLNMINYCLADTMFFDDYSMLNHTNATWSWTFQGGVPSVASIRNPKVQFNTPGTHMVTLEVKDGSGVSDRDTIYVTTSNYTFPTVVNQGFQGVFLPSGFQNVDLDAYGSWSLSTAAGAFGNSSQSAYFNNFDIYSNGGKSDLRFFIDLSTPSLSKLKFDVAFAQYSTANSDTMEVLVSTDCGANFTQVYLKGGSDLATAPDNTNSYVPSSSEWRTDSIDLSSFAGNSQVIVAFRNIGHYGNNLYLDNINLDAHNTTPVVSIDRTEDELNVYPNPIRQGEDILIYDPHRISTYVNVYDAEGRIVLTSETKSSLRISNHLGSGTYIVQIVGERKMKNCKLTVR